MNGRRASSRASTQKSASRVLDSLQDRTLRLYQSMTATRYMNPVHGNIRYIRRPYLVGPIDGQIPQQVGIDLMVRMRPAGSGLGIDRLQTHQPHQPLDAFPVDFVAQSPQMVSSWSEIR